MRETESTEVDALLEKKRMEERKSLRESIDETETDETTLSKRKFLISLVVIFGVAVSFTCSSQFSKYALSIPDDFNAPYFMLWFNTSWMIACFPAFLLYNLIRRTGFKESLKQSLPVLGGSWLWGFLRVLLFLVLWSGSNYSYTKALTFVSSSIAASISSCNAALVWVLAMLLLKDRFVVPKLLAVLFAIGGIVLISLDDQVDAPWLGIVLAIASAVLAALYKVLFKYILGDATLGQVSLFMTCLGLMNIVLNAIPAFLLIFFNAEYLNVATLPWLPLVGSAALGLLFNFLIAFGIALLHPLVIAVGMLLGIPMNTVVDIIAGQVAASVLFICGSVCVIISFLLVIFPFSLIPICRRIGFA
ncbi:hypothetical protein PENTCL1PPCAC_25001 [Pristionchus entomophagus]|uniref:EamA domain-containing protein n=1 Tax=Pristionchus entomophagus TaxID=358040 RepID=A0AAV5U7T2_9BILA|nr:hypothetical protein PENTCL1PPCAC_25001 [Pristionchus entomophagus]